MESDEKKNFNNNLLKIESIDLKTSNKNVEETEQNIDENKSFDGYSEVNDCFDITLKFPETSPPGIPKEPKGPQGQQIIGCFPSQFFALYVFYVLCRFNKNNFYKTLETCSIQIDGIQNPISGYLLKYMYENHNNITIDNEHKTYAYWIDLFTKIQTQQKEDNEFQTEKQNLANIFNTCLTIIDFSIAEHIKNKPSNINIINSSHAKELINNFMENHKEYTDAILSSIPENVISPNITEKNNIKDFTFNIKKVNTDYIIDDEFHNGQYFTMVFNNKNIINTINNNIKLLYETLIKPQEQSTARFGSKKKKKSLKKKKKNNKKKSLKKKTYRRKSYKKVKKVKLIKIKL